MNETNLNNLRVIELKILRHAMSSSDALDEVKSKYNFSLVENSQTLKAIEECHTNNNECNLSLMKLSGFNAPAVETELYAEETATLDKIIDISHSIIKREGIIGLLRETAVKLETDFRPIDVHLDVIMGDIEHINKTHTSKPLFDMTPLSKASAVEVEWITPGWIPIPRRAVTLITAKGGTGKSFVTLQIMLRFLAGNKDKKAFGWFSEDPIGLTKIRADSICRMANIDEEAMNRLTIVGSEQDVHHLYNSDGLTSEFMQVKRILKHHDLIVLDPLIGFYGEDENNNSHARSFMNGLNAWVNKENKAIIVIHHSKKGDEAQSARGAGAFADAARLSYSLTKEKGSKDALEDNLFVNVFKDNYGARYHLGDKEQFRVFPTRNKDIPVEFIEMEG